jgi:hypothetical protein
MSMNHKTILPIIVVAQFCYSLWFASNAVMTDLVINFGLTATAIGSLTSAVQFGFILGTLVLHYNSGSLFSFRVFLVSAMLGALFNGGLIWKATV